MPLYEITLTASKVVKFHAPNRIDAEKRALAAVTELDEIEVTDSGETEDSSFYDYLPDHIREVVDAIEAGDELEVLGVGQTGDRVYDDGEWRVWRERVGPADGYDGPQATVECYDGTRWSDFDPDVHDTDDA